MCQKCAQNSAVKEEARRTRRTPSPVCRVPWRKGSLSLSFSLSRFLSLSLFLSLFLSRSLSLTHTQTHSLSLSISLSLSVPRWSQVLKSSSRNTGIGVSLHCYVQGCTRCKVGFRVQGSGVGLQASDSRLQVSGFRVEG